MSSGFPLFLAWLRLVFSTGAFPVTAAAWQVCVCVSPFSFEEIFLRGVALSLGVDDCVSNLFRMHEEVEFVIELPSCEEEFGV